jgi:hypothetical protein
MDLLRTRCRRAAFRPVPAYPLLRNEGGERLSGPRIHSGARAEPPRRQRDAVGRSRQRRAATSRVHVYAVTRAPERPQGRRASGVHAHPKRRVDHTRLGDSHADRARRAGGLPERDAARRRIPRSRGERGRDQDTKWDARVSLRNSTSGRGSGGVPPAPASASASIRGAPTRSATRPSPRRPRTPLRDFNELQRESRGIDGHGCPRVGPTVWPNWLHRRGPTSVYDPSSGAIQVYVDGFPWVA